MTLNLSHARALFHRELIETNTLSIDAAGVASNADKSQQLSCELALSIACLLYTSRCV